jgi:hypothetical protein
MAHSLDKAKWESYFDTMAKHLGANLVEIEVASMAFGDQIESEWVPLIGISYDPKDDIVEVAVEGVDHLIHGPREIVVEDSVEGIKWVEITDKDDTRQIIKFKQPLALPAP